jgi:hypothetical protein
MTSDEVFEAISHPKRIEILRLLARRPCRFADMKRKLRIKSSGLLDFHLKKMMPIISTDNDGLYCVNERGFAALQAIDVVSRFGWQRRSYLINLFVYAIMNGYLILTNTLWFLVFIPWSAWIVFYSYWTFIKRGAFHKHNDEELEN